MKKWAYYNEVDPVAAEWLRRLIAAGHIAPGEVDERDIRDVAPTDVMGFAQCHWFAGIGIWSHALRRAGFDDARDIWTGSCPCQPFSAAGAGDGFADERHLWPHWHWLVQHCRPGVIVGEQVAGKDGLGWNDLVSADLDGLGYASGAVVTCAAGFGMDWRGSAESERLERAIRLCPDPMVARHMASFAEWADQALGFGGFHIRERQYFVGVANGDCERDGRVWHDGPGEIAGAGQGASRERSTGFRPTGPLADDIGVVNGQRARLEGLGGDGDAAAGREPGQAGPVAPAGPACGMGDGEGRGRGVGGDAMGARPGRYPDGAGDPPVGLADADGGDAATERQQRGGEQRLGAPDDGDGGDGRSRLGDRTDGGVGASPGDGRRGDLDWLFCRDGEWRPVEACPQPVAHAITAELGPIRPEVQKAFEEEIDASFPNGSAATLLRDLLENFAEATLPEIGASRIALPIWQAAVLLAFVRQLAAQGWALAQSIPLSSAEIQAEKLFSLWRVGAIASSSHRRGLDEQRPVQSPDLVHPLSQLLARHCEEAWGFAAESYAEAGFPIGTDSLNRVGRLRAYGNGLDAETATRFVECVIELLDDLAR